MTGASTRPSSSTSNVYESHHTRAEIDFGELRGGVSRTASGIDVIQEARYFKDHPDADRHYGFGFNWTEGAK